MNIRLNRVDMEVLRNEADMNFIIITNLDWIHQEAVKLKLIRFYSKS